MLIYAIIIHVSPVTVDFTLLYHARLQSSQLHVELDNQIANFEIKFPTSARSKFTIHQMSLLLSEVRDIINKWFEDSTPFKIAL